MRQQPNAFYFVLLSTILFACKGPEALRQTDQSSHGVSTAGSTGETTGGISGSTTGTTSTNGRIVGTELQIVTSSGDELRVDSNGLYYRTATGNTLRIKDGFMEWVTPRGRLFHSGNELQVESTIDDPAKVRLASPGRNVSAISFNQLGPDYRHEELALMSVGPTEDDPASLGGEMRFQVKRKNATDDAAMRLMGVISAGYTSNADAIVRWKDINGLGPYSQ